MWKNLKKDGRRIECLNFPAALGYHKTGISLVALNFAGISEGKESFTHCLFRQTYGTCDHPDESLQSIGNNSCTMYQLSLY